MLAAQRKRRNQKYMPDVRRDIGHCGTIMPDIRHKIGVCGTIMPDVGHKLELVENCVRREDLLDECLQHNYAGCLA